MLVKRKNPSLEFTSTIENGEINVTVTAYYTPGCPGRMYMPNGDPGYPPEPAEAEVYKVVNDDNESEIPIESLSKKTLERLTEEAMMYAESDDGYDCE